MCCCFTGVAANCASALAQMSAASCVQEEKEEKEIQEPSDAIAQGNIIKLPTSSYIACKAATGKNFAPRSAFPSCSAAVHYSLVGTWDVCLQYTSCCPRFLILCPTNYILYGTEISGIMHKPTAFFNVCFLNLVILVQPEGIRKTAYLGIFVCWVVM